MKKLWFIIGVIFFLACEDDVYFPAGLYNYQAERLLTDKDEKGTWLISDMSIDGQRQEISNCSDSVRWVFEEVSSDSIAAYSLVFDAQCLFYDTLVFGQVTASGEELLFTDSLYFDLDGTSNDRFVLVTEITSTRLEVNYELSGSAYVASLVKVPSFLLTRQAEAMLTDGLDLGDNATWRAVSETIDDVTSTDLDTCTNAKYFLFERQGNGTVSLVQSVSDSLCVITEESFGSVSVDDSVGFFIDQITLTGGNTNEILFTSFAPSSMSISYLTQDSVSVEAVYTRE